MPHKRLGITGADGIYPVGVQILGTDTDGTRDTAAIGRATTFLPLVSDRRPEAVSAGLVWPFLMPDRRKPDGDYADPKALLDPRVHRRPPAQPARPRLRHPRQRHPR